MYAVVACNACKRKRVIDLSTRHSKCPYCENQDTNKDLQILYRSEDQSMARAALSQLTGFSKPPEKKKPSEDTDPLSTLVYRYEHCRDLDMKLEILAEGLTRIYGTFTEENVLEVDPKNGEKMMKKMLVDGFAHEVKYGRYSA